MNLQTTTTLNGIQSSHAATIVEGPNKYESLVSESPDRSGALQRRFRCQASTNKQPRTKSQAAFSDSGCICSATWLAADEGRLVLGLASPTVTDLTV